MSPFLKWNRYLPICKCLLGCYFICGIFITPHCTSVNALFYIVGFIYYFSYVPVRTKDKAVLNLSVVFRSMRVRFAGVPGSLLGSLRLWGLPCPVIPQESRAFRSNQQSVLKSTFSFNTAKDKNKKALIRGLALIISTCPIQLYSECICYY